MIKELVWDSAFFGRKIGKNIDVPHDEDLLRDELADAARQEFVYLNCRLPAYDITVVQRLERYGFYLTDIGIVWETRPEELNGSITYAREASFLDAVSVQEIAAGLFRDGRFYHDPFFTHEEADRLYKAWAENAIKGQADKVFLVENKGFIACKVSGSVGEIPLIGVAEPYQGQGIGAVLVRAAAKWFLKMNIKSMAVRTQAGNTKAVKFYERNGFKIKRVDITMAKAFSS